MLTVRALHDLRETQKAKGWTNEQKYRFAAREIVMFERDELGRDLYRRRKPQRECVAVSKRQRFSNLLPTARRVSSRRDVWRFFICLEEQFQLLIRSRTRTLTGARHSCCCPDSPVPCLVCAGAALFLCLLFSSSSDAQSLTKHDYTSVAYWDKRYSSLVMTCVCRRVARPRWRTCHCRTRCNDDDVTDCLLHQAAPAAAPSATSWQKCEMLIFSPGDLFCGGGGAAAAAAAAAGVCWRRVPTHLLCS